MKRKIYDSVRRFHGELIHNFHKNTTAVYRAAKCTANIGTAFEQLGYIEKARDHVFYCGPTPVPVSVIVEKYDQIRAGVEKQRKDKLPKRPAPEPYARPFPEPQDFTLVPITEKQATGMAFDLHESGYNVRIFRPDGGFDIELNHEKPFKP